MIQEDEILEQYMEKEEIKNIFELVKNKKIIKTKHFYFKIFERNISEDLINDTFPLVDKIKLIDKRKHKTNFGYDFYYELSNSRTLKLCFVLLNGKVLLVNAILRHRKWQGSIKQLDRK